MQISNVTKAQLNMFFIPFNWSKPQTCNRSRQGLSTFDPLFNEVTDEMYQRLTKRFNLMMTSLDDALDFYNNQTDKVEKGFLDLFLVVGKNNVSEVIFWQNKFYIWTISITNWYLQCFFMKLKTFFTCSID